jgi:RHS repeat-associated protein
LLYSGEQFDARIAMQYLRARYYDPATGRFNGVDPAFGSLHDPLSLHKYSYVHGDPVMGVDPSGLEFSLLGSLNDWTLLQFVGRRHKPQLRVATPLLFEMHIAEQRPGLARRAIGCTTD